MSPQDSKAENRIKYESGDTDQRHRFLRKRHHINIRFLDRFAEPITDTQCQINYDDGMKTKGVTDERGWLRVLISDAAEYADVVIEDVTEDSFRRVRLTPIRRPRADMAEVEQRLSNIGFSVNPDVTKGILEFQEEYDLELTGKADPAFKAKLDEVYKHHRDKDGYDEDEGSDIPDEDDQDIIDENEGRT